MEDQLKTSMFGSKRQEVFARINSYRDDGTHADEALRFFKVLFYISMVFTVGYGVALHYNLTLPYLGKNGAIAFAVFFTAFIEVGKYIVGRWTLRTIFFGMFWQGMSSALITLAGVLITVGSFWWSYYNSTQGVSYITTHLAEKHVERPVVDMAAATTDVDARQTEVGKMAKRGLSIQWRGNVTRSGQRIAERAALANAEQEKQRTILIEKAAREQERLDTHRNAFIDNVATLLAMLGGKMEWFQVIMLVGMIAAEKTLNDRMKQKGRGPTSNNDSFGGSDSFRAHKTPPPYQNKGAFQNSAQTGPIGFNVDPETGNVHSTINGLPKDDPKMQDPEVCHSVPHTERQDYYISADAVLQNAKTRLSREMANLRNTNGDPRTVCRRIHAVINEVGQSLSHKAFKPSEKLATDFYTYMDDTVNATLAMHRRPYEFQKEFMADLRRHCNEAELYAHHQEHFEA